MRVTAIVLLIVFTLCGEVYAEIPEAQAVRVLIGEAAGEGESGMTAVAEVLRRRGSVRGFYGLNASHVDKQPPWVFKMAQRAWYASKTSNLTKGATHFESTDFTVPYWAKSMRVTAVIGKHRFYAK